MRERERGGGKYRMREKQRKKCGREEGGLKCRMREREKKKY